MYRNQFGVAALSATWRVTSVASEQLPRHVFVAFASNERDESEKQNNQVFDNSKLTWLSVRVNSRQYPDREIETNFTKGSENYSRAYMLFQEVVKKYLDADSGSQVSVKDFASLYPDHTCRRVQAQRKAEDGHGRPRSTMAVGKQL